MFGDSASNSLCNKSTTTSYEKWKNHSIKINFMKVILNVTH